MKDLSDLPTQGPESHEGIPQVEPSVTLTGPMAEYWMQRYLDSGRDDKPFAIDGTVVRGSWAGKCARQISYRMLGIEVTNPPDIAAFWRMEMGTITHDYWQAVGENMWGDDFQVEVVATFMDEKGSLHSDALFKHPDFGMILVELKTVGGFKLKASLGLVKSADGPGPSPDHFLQGALGAKAHGADKLMIIYIGQENINKGWAADKELHPAEKFSAEWMYTKEQWFPYGEKEENRLRAISELAKDSTLAPRHIPILMPTGGRITNIKQSSWELKHGEEVTQVGAVWHGNYCLYCPFMERCEADHENDV